MVFFYPIIFVLCSIIFKKNYMDSNHSDIIIIGAGLSGIGACHHLSRKNPDKTYLILEARTEVGGTWSLFQYPGIRSDSVHLWLFL
jgi:cation diffusion facilitator CzcD-associated flavoprotein CzcO